MCEKIKGIVMKYSKVLLFLNWSIITIGLSLYILLNINFFLIPVSISLIVVSIIEYKKLKKNNSMDYQEIRVIFVYIIGAIFTFFVFIKDTIR